MLAVKPTDKIVVSPAAGTIVKIFNTNHAFCLETEKARRSSSIWVSTP
ncbi:PTS glucose transporter subunit IIA [Escherichia coli]